MHAFQLAKKKNFMYPFGLVLMIIAVAVITGISALFFNNQFALASGNQLVLKDVSEGYLSGAYKIKSAKDSNLCFDVEGGVELENGIKILAFGSHTYANQKFNFTPIECNGSYIYTISTIYSDTYVLDISGGLPDENTSLQIYQYNSTAAQKFMIKAVYVGETFKGYVLLTGTTGYQKVLSNSNGYIVQKSFNYGSLDLNQVWYFEQCFSGNTYSESGYLDSNKNSGGYGSFYDDTDDWEKIEQFITIDTSSSFKASDARISSEGYTFFDSVNLNLRIDNELKFEYDEHWLGGNLYIEVGSDKSNYVNGKYVNGTVGKGTMEIEYTDTNGEKHSEFKNNIFSSYDTSSIFFSKQFSRVGKYSIRFYYKVLADYYDWGRKEKTTYVMKEINFAIISSSSTGTALSAQSDNQDPKVLSSYDFSLNRKNEILVGYNGKAKLKAKDQDIINYVAGVSVTDSNSIIKQKIEKLKNNIAKYKEYKVFFTNSAFYINAYGNKHVEISESVTGYNSVVPNIYRGKSSINNTDGIYEYETKNLYKTEKNFYRVYVQCQPNQQVFRNVTYCFKNENGETINYAIDYAFLEDLKIFPYTMTVNISYINLDDENAKPVDYVSNSIIYNTSNDILKLKFTILDLSGNESTLFLYIYPPNTPSLNLENLTQMSYDYNYITTGYEVLLYDGETGKYNYYLFSTYDVAFENLVTNMLSNPDVCKVNDDGSYSVNCQSTVTTFESNYEFMQWLTEYAQTHINYKSISPNDYGKYTIPEKNMRFDTLYLTKDFIFTTDTYFPLFESYKVYFNYYSQDGRKIKDGIITYDGDYKYGETMFKILADENLKNWVSGYVEFTEYNISANSGTTYTARIVNSNPTLQIKVKDGTKYENIICSGQKSITCEQFEFIGSITEDTTIIVEFNNNKTYYNYYTYQNIKFNEIGEYKISVINTHKFGYVIEIMVESLASSFEGVANFGETTENVKFTTEDLNFKCYINGKLQTDFNYVLSENNLYTITFKKQEVDSNIHIIKNGRTFSFIIKGDKELDLSDYNIEELSKFTLVEIRNHINMEVEKLNQIIYDANNLTDEYSELKNTFNKLENNKLEGDFDALTESILALGDKKHQIEQAYAELMENNLVLQVVEKENINLLKENIKLISTSHEEESNKLKTFAINYFYEKYNITMTENIYNELKDKQETEIIDLYSKYTDEVNMYAKLSSKMIEMETYIHSYDSTLENYKRAVINIDGIEVDNLNHALSLLNEYEKFEKEYYTKIASFKTELTSLSVLNSTNIFVKEYLIDQVKTQVNQVTLVIDEHIKNQSFEVYEKIKEIAVNVVNNYDTQITNLTTQTTKSYNEYTKALNELEEEKEWWKIFSNISRNNKIEEYNKKISDLIDNFRYKKMVIQSDASEITDLLNQINKSENIIIEAYIYNTITNWTKELNNVSSKIA